MRNRFLWQMEMAERQAILDKAIHEHLKANFILANAKGISKFYDNPTEMLNLARRKVFLARANMESAQFRLTLCKGEEPKS